MNGLLANPVISGLLSGGPNAIRAAAEQQRLALAPRGGGGMSGAPGAIVTQDRSGADLGAGLAGLGKGLSAIGAMRDKAKRSEAFEAAISQLPPEQQSAARLNPEAFSAAQAKSFFSTPEKMTTSNTALFDVDGKPLRMSLEEGMRRGLSEWQAPKESLDLKGSAETGLYVLERGPDGKLVANMLVPPRGPQMTSLQNDFMFARKNGFDGSFVDFVKTTRQKDDAGNGGPFAGNAMDAQVMNMLIQGDPNTPEYAAAYAHRSQEKVQFDQTTGQSVTIRPDMSAFRAPTFRQGSGAPAQPGAVDLADPVDPAVPVAGPGAAAPPPGPAMPPGSTVIVQQVAPPQPKPMNEGQANAALFADRMTKADEIIQKVWRAGTSTLERGKAAIPGIGNYLVSPEYQQYDQAKRDFINAVLRRESGAVIGDTEFESAEKQYFPEPGDERDPRILEQKAASRKTAIDAIARAAGAGYTPPQAAPAAPTSTAIPPPPGSYIIME
jgi:hypothetical protein